MAFMVSPGISISEVDLTAGAQAVSVSDAAFAGPFQWGPALEVRSIDSEDGLVASFGKPNDDNFSYWFSAAAFLAYSNRLRVVRALPTTALNATTRAKLSDSRVTTSTGNTTVIMANSTFTTANLVAGQTVTVNTTNFVVASVTNTSAFVVTSAPADAWTNTAFATYGFLVRNDDHYETTFVSGVSSYGPWVGKYAGSLINGVTVSLCPGEKAFENANLTGTATFTSGNLTVSGSGTAFNTEVTIGDKLVANGTSATVALITNATSLILASAWPTSNVAATAGNWTRKWGYASLFDRAPSTSLYASARAGANDEMHVAVVDTNGTFTGVPGTVLERFPFVSKAIDAKNANGEGNYYVDVINKQSKYARWIGTPNITTTSWGSSALSTTFGAAILPSLETFTGGSSNNATISDANLQTAYDMFKNADIVDISLVITGPAGATLASYIIQNICEPRADAIAFVSPARADVVNNAGAESTAIATFRNSLPSSSYAFCDSGWKYTFDKYNDKFRWVPLNGDMAGIAARSDSIADPWFSPAGTTRGNVKNVIKLAWNPKQLERDDIYKLGVNPVVSFPGQGTMLFGDKTLLSRPSAFDRINVRRLFIILEKTVARLARTQLFEFNDEFTRSQFKNVVEPYLRDVRARRGVVDFRVVCDESNNTAQVIEENRFVGDIFVKPSRAINFIQLNFVAVRNGVSFQEVTGAA